MDSLSDTSMGLTTTPKINTPHNTKFKSGKHRGETYSHVMKTCPHYFLWLAAQPASSVEKYFGFIRYCLDAMRNYPVGPDDPMLLTPS